jgi:hypothetical protein
MQGLAQQMAGAPAQQPQADMQMIEQIIQLLMDGVDPQELVQQGIPPEIIMQAIDILEQQLAQQQPQMQQGLAQSMMR